MSECTLNQNHRYLLGINRIIGNIIFRFIGSYFDGTQIVGATARVHVTFGACEEIIHKMINSLFSFKEFAGMLLMNYEKLNTKKQRKQKSNVRFASSRLSGNKMTIN